MGLRRSSKGRSVDRGMVGTGVLRRRASWNRAAPAFSGFYGIDDAQGAVKLGLQRKETHAQRLTFRDNHVIMAGSAGSGIKAAQGVLEPAANAVAENRVADFFCHGEAETGRAARFTGSACAKVRSGMNGRGSWSCSRLQRERLGVEALSFRRVQKLKPLLQTFGARRGLVKAISRRRQNFPYNINILRRRLAV